MAKIALRNYNIEIGDLIDHGQIDEAIAHCRQILKVFPKHVDTYRMLGKAYLESQRYGDAADILQRVLSSLPDDFISQVGMSIIREDDGNMDAAIWHMERAFETQPSNQAIQNELRRLFGRRDGLEPSKIRLSRGALARMYAYGNLYDQAIAELHSALSEDPQRHDLLLLLAKMYFESDKETEAVETANLVLNKLPHCLEANLILVSTLHNNDRADEARAFQDKLFSLDPYANHVDEKYPHPSLVKDQAVLVDRLTWGEESYGESYGDSPSFSDSSWANNNEESDKTPTWLKKATGGLDPNFVEETPNLDGESVDAPQWLKEAQGQFNRAESDEENPELEPGEGKTDSWVKKQKINESPDWLNPIKEEESSEYELASGEESSNLKWLTEKAIPESYETNIETNTIVEPEVEEESEQEVEGTPEWFPTFDQGGAESAIGELGALPSADALEAVASEKFEAGPGDPDDTIESVSDASEVNPTGVEDSAEQIPDFLKDSGWEKSESEEQPSSILEDSELDDLSEIEKAQLPDWLADNAPEVHSISEQSFEEDADFLKALNLDDNIEPSSTESESPDVMMNLEEQGNADEISEPVAPSGGGDNSMDWLNESKNNQDDENEPSGEGASNQEAPSDNAAEDDGMAWLESLAAKQGVAEEEFVTPAEDRSEAAAPNEDTPDWLSAEIDEPANPEVASPIIEASTESIDTGSTEVASSDPTSTDGEDDGMAWLESLAANQGVGEEELVTQAEDRLDASAPDEDDPDWLSTPIDESDAPEIAAPIRETPAKPLDVTSPDARSTDDENDGIAWLESLAANQGAGEEELNTPASDRSDAAPAEGDTPDWLESAIDETVSPDAARPIPETPVASPEDEDDGMAWLESLAENQGASKEELVTPVEERSDAVAPDEDTPDWLTSAIDEPSGPETAASIPEASAASSDAGLSDEDDDGMDWLELLNDSQSPTEEVDLTQPDEPKETVAPEIEQPTLESEKDALEEDSLDWLGDTEDMVVESQTSAEDQDSKDLLKTLTDSPPLDKIIEDVEEEEDLSWLTEELHPPEPRPTTNEETTPGENDDDWIAKLKAEAPQESLSTSAEEDSMDWLDQLDDIDGAPELATPEEQEILEDDLDWLEDLPAESDQKSTQPEPTSQDEWIPETNTSAETIAEVSTPTGAKTAPKPDNLSPHSVDLDLARQTIKEGDINTAVDVYTKLIKKGKHTKEIIEDLNEGLRKHPVDAILWQTLGDAFTKANRLQEALDAYTKAEDLLR